uniref:Fusion product n=1 Tax=Pseudomonas aeruginosa TaxID=287 RepID=Q4W1U0_PSEAI|nr:fusion product [Pseudomonas aeruginosa]
MSSESSLGKV